MIMVVIGYYAIGVMIYFWTASGAAERPAGLSLLSIPPMALLLLRILAARREYAYRIMRNWRSAWPFIMWCGISFCLGMLHHSPDLPRSVAFIELLFFLMIGVAFLIPCEPGHVRHLDMLLAMLALTGTVLGIYGLVSGYTDVFQVAQGHNIGAARYGVGVGRSGIAASMRIFSTYLLLKYARSANGFALIGLVGLSVGAYISMTTGARNAVFVFFLTILFGAYLILRTEGESRRRAYILGLLMIAFAGVFFAYQMLAETSAAALFMARMRIWTGVAGSARESGFANDPRIQELLSARPYLLNPWIVTGYGIGSAWYDDRSVFSFPWRLELHINWFHYLFKLGVTGLLFYLLALFTRIRSDRSISLPYLGFLCLWMYSNTTYGFKLPTPTTLIYFYILYNPVVFLIGSQGNHPLRNRMDAISAHKRRRWPDAALPVAPGGNAMKSNPYMPGES